MICPLELRKFNSHTFLTNLSLTACLSWRGPGTGCLFLITKLLSLHSTRTSRCSIKIRGIRMPKCLGGKERKHEDRKLGTVVPASLIQNCCWATPDPSVLQCTGGALGLASLRAGPQQNSALSPGNHIWKQLQLQASPTELVMPDTGEWSGLFYCFFHSKRWASKMARKVELRVHCFSIHEDASKFLDTDNLTDN